MQKHDEHHSHKEAKAYEIWESEGRPTGRDLEHWLKAERQVSEALPAQKPINTVAPPPPPAAAAEAAAPARRFGSLRGRKAS